MTKYICLEANKYFPCTNPPIASMRGPCGHSMPHEIHQKCLRSDTTCMNTLTKQEHIRVSCCKVYIPPIIEADRILNDK